MNDGLDVKKQDGRVVIARPTNEKRLEELANKKGAKSPAEVNEEILLRLLRIEKRLGIK